MSDPSVEARPQALRSSRYEMARLRKLAQLAHGHTVLDLGHAQIPNPFLEGRHRVGFDLERSAPGGVRYEEEFQGDVRDIATVLRGRTFDTVICGELIEHLENPYEFLRSLAPLIARGGRLLLSTPNPLSFPVLFIELARSRRYFYTSDHRYYFTPRWVERLLSVTGYELQAAKSVGLWLPFGVLKPCPVALSYQVAYVAVPRGS